MATFKKGESMTKQRIVVSAQFDQKGEGRSGKNVALSIANDKGGPENAMTDPMLVYDTYEDKNGDKKPTFTASYSSAQWDKIAEAANKDGDALVVEGDVFPNRHGKGLVVNTNTLSTPEESFDKAAHDANTLAAREAKAEARKAAAAEKAAEKGKETEKAVELEAE